MALINCKECGKEISDTCKTCIHCGAKTETSKANNKKLIRNISILVIIILLVGNIFILYNNKPIVKQCNNAIALLEQYKKDEINTSKLIDELKLLSNDIRILSIEEENKENQLKLSSLSTTIELISNRISNNHKDTSNTEIDKYIKEIKEFKY